MPASPSAITTTAAARRKSRGTYGAPSPTAGAGFSLRPTPVGIGSNPATPRANTAAAATDDTGGTRGSGGSIYSWGAMYTRGGGVKDGLPSADRPERRGAAGGVGGRLFGVGNTPGSLW